MTQRGLPSQQTTFFDDVVIGSSPLMLLQAGMLARAGRNVCLIERQSRLGGSWQTAVLENGEEVEIACHLIEFFPEVYQLLEEASDTPFTALNAQPIRIHQTGLKFPYFSRVLMCASGLRLMIGWAKARLEWMRGTAPDRNRLINFETKLSSYLRHQLPVFFRRPIMKGPKHGFVDFMDRLVARTLSDGVIIQTADITTLNRTTDGLWQVCAADGGIITAEHLHCTTSTNLRKVRSGHFEAVQQDFAHRFCVVAEVANQDVKLSQTYVAFWKDPIIARVSRIDMPDPKPVQRFLVEFHNADPAAHSNCDLIVRDHLERSDIIHKGGEFQIVGQVDCHFSANVDQLPAGEIDTNLWGYYSSGNLAAGLAAWRKTERLPQLTRSDVS